MSVTRLCFFLSALLLSGCRALPFNIGEDYAGPPYIQTFQKAYRLGHTDTEQRRQDLYDCGVEREYPLHSWDESWRRNVRRSGESDEQFHFRINKIEVCMENKGYITLGFLDCGSLKRPTGLCN